MIPTLEPRPSIVIEPGSGAVTPGTDWYGDGRAAAARAAGQPGTRDFGFPKREPAPRRKKEFGWDKAHTERVSGLAEGGIVIRLSDNCALVINPCRSAAARSADAMRPATCSTR